jgi:hypothetical protein
MKEFAHPCNLEGEFRGTRMQNICAFHLCTFFGIRPDPDQDIALTIPRSCELLVALFRRVATISQSNPNRSTCALECRFE